MEGTKMKHLFLRFSTFGAAALLSMAPLACAPSGTDQSTGEPTSLRDVDIPADFTFATSRGVALTVSADSQLIGPEGAAAIEVARLDGKVLYRGPVMANQPLAVDLIVPTKDDAVNVKLTPTSGDQRVSRVAITDGAAAQTFQ